MYEQPFNPFLKNLSVVKDYCKSPLVLAMGIVRIVSSALTIATPLIITSMMPGFIEDIKALLFQLAESAGLPYASIRDMSSVLDSASKYSSGFTVPAALPSMVITLLIAAAFIIIYVKSRNEDPSSSPVAGITILYVFAIIEMIAAIIAAVLIVLCAVVLIWAYFQLKAAAGNLYVFTIDLPTFSQSWDIEITPAMLLGVIIGGMVAALIAVGILLFYTISKKRFYGSIRNSTNSVELQNKGAKPYGVLCIISAVFTAMSLLSTLSLFFLGIRFKAMIAIAAMYAASTLVSFVTTILEAKFALGYKRHIDNMKYGYNQPGGPAAPYSPYPMGGYGAPQNQTYGNPYVNAAPNNAAPAGYGYNNNTNPYAANSYEPAADNAYSDPYGTDAPAEPEAPAEDYAIPSVDEAFAGFDETPAADAAPEEAAEAASVCPSCGAELDPGSVFCGNCGYRL